MINAEQARRDLNANKQADLDQQQRDGAKRAEAQRQEIARALREDVPKYIAEVETKIYEAVAARQSDIKYAAEASAAVSECFDVVKKELEAHGYKVTKEHYTGTQHWDEVNSTPYNEWALYITWGS